MRNHEIRAVYSQETIWVYQAYPHDIADEAVRLGTFGQRFKMDRMTWIKPSFLWMMYRCGWAEKENQEQIKRSQIRCQWDPERDLLGNPLEYRSIQLGLRGQAIYSYVHDWIINLEDITDYVKELNVKRISGTDIRQLLPQEKVYPISDSALGNL